MQKARNSFYGENDKREYVIECEKRFERSLDLAIERVISQNNKIITLSGPTCSGKTTTAKKLISEFEERVRKMGLSDMNIKVALMGCAVNGPGEAREADIGIAGGIGEGLIFKKGEILRKVKEDKLLDELIHEIILMKEGGK
jgi:4-hydroxy-3-methylbut-2-en-1-yl diphosphate synthase IspG/GcpE